MAKKPQVIVDYVNKGFSPRGSDDNMKVTNDFITDRARIVKLFSKYI